MLEKFNSGQSDKVGIQMVVVCFWNIWMV